MRPGKLIGSSALAALASAVILTAGPASAGKNNIRVSFKGAEIPVLAGTINAARPRVCTPKNATVSIGSGFDLRAEGSAPDADLVLNHLIGGGATANNLGTGTGVLRAERYCLRGSFSDRRIRKATQLAPMTSGRIFGSCDRGFTPVDPGFEMREKGGVGDAADLAKLRVTGLYIKHRGKKPGTLTEADNTHGSSEFRVYTHATCYRLGSKLVRGSASTVVPAGGEASATATCPRRSVAVTGGFRGDPGTYPLSSLRTGKRKWSGTAGRAGPGDGLLKVFAYCLKR